MIKIKHLILGFLTLGVIFIASLLSQNATHTEAMSTLTADNQIISVATTDGLAAAVSPTTVSADGNVMLFMSNAMNLPNAGGTNYSVNSGLYTYNIKTNTTTRIDTSAAGVSANNQITSSVMSANGRYILFTSLATNLIDGSTLYPGGTYIRDLQSGTVTIVENHYYEYNFDWSLGISNDGRFVLLGSRYILMTANKPYNLVYGDRQSGSFVWRKIDEGFDVTSTYFNAGNLSCEGSIIAYSKGQDSIAKDLRNNTTTGTTLGLLPGVSPIVSCDGNYILYATANRTQISPTPAGMSAYVHLVEYNRMTGIKSYIDSNDSGVFDNNHWTNLTGSSINIFNASVANTGDVVLKYNGNYYIKHLSDGSGTLEPVAKTLSGSYINVSTWARITADGRYVFFTADPYDLGLVSSPAGIQIIRARTNL